MGVLRDSGSTKLNISSISASRPSAEDELLQAVRQTAAGEFEVFGEIGRAPDGTVSYLARELASKGLVALRLTPPGSGAEYLLEVVRQLDASVPGPHGTCPRCGAALRSWGRFCTRCGLDIWTASFAHNVRTNEDVMAAVREATRDKFEILGEMRSVGGVGIVYFARDVATGKIEALRLRQEGEREYSIGVTSILRRVVTDKKP